MTRSGSVRIITIANHKGGIGKTTTAVTLAHGLALAGKQVLIADLDGQGHVALSLNLPPGQSAHLLFALPDPSAAPGATLLPAIHLTRRDHLWIMPGGSQLDAVQTALGVNHSPMNLLRESLAALVKQFDYIVIDTSPTHGGIQERALFAADFVIIPTSCRLLSIDAARETAMLLEQLRKMGWQGDLIGILPTFYRSNTYEGKSNLAALRAAFGSVILEPVREAEALARASTNGQTIFEWDPACPAARAYQKVVNRVLWLK